MRRGALLAPALLACLGCGAGNDAPARPPAAEEVVAVGREGGIGGEEDPAAVSGPDSVVEIVRAPPSDGDVLLVDVLEVRRKLEAKAPMLLIDARGRGDFEKEHIPGAINVPLPKIAAAGRLPGIAKDYEIVVYCISETCPLSKNAARALTSLGYANVKDMRAGLLGWKSAGLATTRGAG